MASILSGWGALAADGDTIIASKAYVDAMDATKQNKLNSGDGGNITVSGTGNVVTGITASNGAVTVTKGNIAATDFVKNTDTVNNETKTNVLEFDNDANHAPSITAVKNMKTTSVRATGAVDTLVPTEAAVRSAITSATSTLNTNIENTASGITGQFESTVVDNGSGTIIAEDTGEAPDNVVVDADHPNLIPRNYNIQQGIAYLEGTGIENHNKSNQDGVSADEIANTDSAWDTIIGAKEADDYVPTIASVEKRVLAAIDTAGANISKETNNVYSSSNTTYLPTVAGVQAGKDNTASATWANNTLTFVSGDADGNRSNKVATSAAVNTSVSALKSYTDHKITTLDNASEATDSNNTYHTPIVAVSEADGIVTATRGTISYQDAMENALKDVNNKANTQTCNAANPCVLTYIGTQASGVPEFRWTQMDTEGVNAGV